MVLIAGLDDRLLTSFSLRLSSIVVSRTLKICFISRGLGFFVSEQWRKVQRILFECLNLVDERANFKKK